MLAEALEDLTAAIAECCEDDVVESAAVAVGEGSWTTVTLARPRGRSNPEIVLNARCVAYLSAAMARSN